jgi:hypothetical protein
MTRKRSPWRMRAVILGATLGLVAAAWQVRRLYRARGGRLRTAVERWEGEGGALDGRSG